VICEGMVVQLDKCVVEITGEFSFASILCDFIFKQVVLLRS
jgi:hypothetical protein